MSTQQLLFSDFSKGLRAGTMRVSQQESAELVNLDHIAGSLATVPVAQTLTPSDIATDTGAIHNVFSIEPYIDANGLTSYIARRGHCVWIGRPQASFERIEPSSGLYAQYEMTEDIDPVHDHAGGVAGKALTNSGSVVEQLWSTNVRHFDGFSAVLSDTASGYAGRFNFAATGRAVSVWIRIDSVSTHGAIILGKSNNFIAGQAGWALGLNSSGKLLMFVSDGTNWVQAASVVTLNLNQWYHIGASYDPASNFFPQLYIDSVLIAGAMVTNTSGGTGATIGVNCDNAYAFSIGGVSGGGGAFFKGSVGCLSVYSAGESGIFTGHWIHEFYRYFESTNPYTPVSYRWTPLLVDITDGATVQLLARLPLCKERVKQIGYRAYFSPESPSASDYLMAWDGVIVDKILVTNAGSAVGGYNLYSVSNNTAYGIEGEYQFESAGIQPGDVLLYNPGVWPLQGHIITAVCTTRGSGYGVYTSEPPLDTACTTACEAVIVRVRRAGVVAGEATG